MPFSDFWLINSSSHNPNQNDSGSVLQGTWATGMYCTSGAAPVFLTNQFFSSSQDFLKWNQRQKSARVWVTGFMVVSKLWNMLNTPYGWNNSLMKHQHTNIKKGEQLYIKVVAALLWTFERNTAAAPLEQTRQSFVMLPKNSWNRLVKSIFLWDSKNSLHENVNIWDNVLTSNTVVIVTWSVWDLHVYWKRMCLMATVV